MIRVLKSSVKKFGRRSGYLLYPIAALVLALLLSILFGGPLATGGPPQAGSEVLVFTQLPAGQKLEKAGPLANGMLRQSYGDGARIVRLRPGGKPELLSSGFHSAADPEISFDGTRLLFAGKRKSGDNWDIYEIGLNGTGLKQVTKNMGNCRNPIYLGAMFTLDSKEPWYQVGFVSDRAQESNELVDAPATDLYSCQMDGSDLRRLTFNPSSDMDPCMLPDGRILFAAWQGAVLSHGPLGRVSLLAVNTDGTDCAVFATEEGQRIKHMPAVTTSGLVIFVEADRSTWDGAGTLASVTLRRNLHSHKPITRESDGLFVFPSTLPDGQILVSRRDNQKQKTHALTRLDPATGQSTVIFDDPKYHDIQARVAATRPNPDGHSSVVVESEPTGKIYCLNANFSQAVEGGLLPSGKATRIRVLEGLPRKVSTKAQSAGQSANGIPALMQKRFLGEVDLDDDGSFNIQVPANIPIQLQLLDSHGASLFTSDWLWAKNKENKGCIGCHEDYELAPPNVFAKSLSRASTQFTLAAEKRRTLDFRRDVMPIVAAKCATAACHGASGSKVVLDSTLDPIPEGSGRFNRSYVALLVPDPDNPRLGKYVHPGRARTSPLIWHLLGNNATQSWDKVISTGRQEIQPMPPAGRLTDEEIRTFIEWIDLGALWDGIPGEDRFSASGGHPNSGGKR